MDATDLGPPPEAPTLEARLRATSPSDPTPQVRGWLVRYLHDPILYNLSGGLRWRTDEATHFLFINEKGLTSKLFFHS